MKPIHVGTSPITNRIFAAGAYAEIMGDNALANAPASAGN